MSSRRLVSALAIAILVGLVPARVYAHGFGERYDLPVPLNYFLVGAAATVALSFVVIGFFVRQRPGIGFFFALLPSIQPARVPLAWRLPHGLAAARPDQGSLGGGVRSSGRRRAVRHQQADRQPLADLRMDNLVGRDGLLVRTAWEPLDAGQPVEDHLRVG